jgi:GWxTD domain-containing protein
VRTLKLTTVVLLAAGAIFPAGSDWLTTVAPVISPAEKKSYSALPPAARAAFEEKFWSTKSIDAEEYYRRLAFVDSHFGSSKPGSGANTDPGRVYLSLGAPTKISRIPSSRIFVPLEIWYYDSIPGYLNTELRLIFYQANSTGLPKLYSPTMDTVRALLLPEASTVHMFGPNDSVTENDILQNLRVGPAENEVITAAVGVASGIKTTGNDEILGQILSPAYMLSKIRSTLVTSRLITARPELSVLRTASFHGASQIDLRLTIAAEKEISLAVLQGFNTIYNNRLNLTLAQPQQIEYVHRLDLLPGSYRLMFTVDSKTFAYPLEISQTQAMGEIERADPGQQISKRFTPFEFGGRQITLNPTGSMALVSVPQPGKVAWTIRDATHIVWRAESVADTIATVELPAIPPGPYRLEAMSASDWRKTDIVIQTQRAKPSDTTLVSFNANLAPARRLAFIGNQWLLRGRFDQARETLNESLAKASITRDEVKDAQIALARVDALSGDLDAARDRVRSILATHPNDFEALSAYAFIETKFQDYSVAAELYRRALAVQDSPALRMALAKLPTQ